MGGDDDTHGPHEFVDDLLPPTTELNSEYEIEQAQNLAEDEEVSPKLLPEVGKSIENVEAERTNEAIFGISEGSMHVVGLGTPTQADTENPLLRDDSQSLSCFPCGLGGGLEAAFLSTGLRDENDNLVGGPRARRKSGSRTRSTSKLAFVPLMKSSMFLSWRRKVKLSTFRKFPMPSARPRRAHRRHWRAARA
eukprot:TRINITY_DN21180_c0_g1_i1.p1 TRINITY_DN21180_c0_g1~~TRINITY_DN21180_c0_g1_i1.p1  ORF type:complete len:193 (+),score=29.99 TRINITY_DN21180_c0_g1_i1:3-581(+)